MTSYHHGSGHIYNTQAIGSRHNSIKTLPSVLAQPGKEGIGARLVYLWRNWFTHQQQDGYMNSRFDSRQPCLWKNYLLLLSGALILLAWLPTQRQRFSIRNDKIMIDQLINSQKLMVKKIETHKSAIQKSREEVHTISESNDLTFEKLNFVGNWHPDFKDKTFLQTEEAEERLLNRIDTLEQYVQEESKKAIHKRYGAGPYRARVSVEEGNGNTWSFAIELAPLNEMPHAVHHFMKMIEARLWDGLMLVHSNDVLVTSTVSSDVSHTWAGQRFLDAQLTQLVFQELSSTYPPAHQRMYTVAFSGRPGGPDFYICLDDNVELHDHESTFGTVVNGKAKIDRFVQTGQHQQPSGSKKKTQMMTIKSIVLE